MPLLTLSNISKSYGASLILDAISLQLQPGDKVGLIGPNGSGKTTLLKIIAGEIDADSGSRQISRNTQIGYLTQQPPVLTAATLRSHLEYPLRHLFGLQEELANLENAIAAQAAGAEKDSAARDRLDKDLEQYAALTANLETAGGYLAESRLLSVARGLGFAANDLERDIASFSGGEKTRARLAGLLLREIDLLLLDEPTNFLDLSALEWLEKYLRDLNCALIVVSHDRFFLDRATGRIFALQNQRLKAYKGNYSAYRKKLEQENINFDREYRKQQLLKSREERLVREAKADERSKRQARSRQKRLDRLELNERPENEQRFNLDLGFSGRSGRLVVSFDDVSCVFGEGEGEGEAPLFSGLTFAIRWGERIALVGPNGAGKSTLLKMIAGELKPQKGAIRLGPSVEVVYLTQEQEQLAANQTLVEVITAASDSDIKTARNHLGRYLFRGDDVFKKVRDLSGGEKSRLALASLALNSGNCLMMDEPTSHLDLPALEELEKALLEYPGTLIVVSHDRYFLKSLATRVFVLENGALRIYENSFLEYLELQENELHKRTSGETGRLDEKRRRQEEHYHRQARQKEKQRLKNQQAKIEQQIAEIEQEVARLELTLSNPELYGDRERLAELGIRLEEARARLGELLTLWEELASELFDSEN